MPTNRRARKPQRRFPPEVLSDAEVRALMDASGVYAVIAQRNRALLAFFYSPVFCATTGKSLVTDRA